MQMVMMRCQSQWSDSRFEVGHDYELVSRFIGTEFVTINPFDPAIKRVEQRQVKKLQVKLPDGTIVVVKSDYFITVPTDVPVPKAVGQATLF